jgi:nitrogen regulatory protein PII
MPNLIVVILTDMEVYHDVLRVWEEAGVPGATILNSLGMRHHQQRHAQRDDLPLIPSLRSILEQDEFSNRTIFSVVPDDFDVEDLIRRTEALVGNFDTPHTGLLFVVPVTTIRGLSRHSAAEQASAGKSK